MKRIISDKPYLILQLLSIVAIFAYLFFTTGYQHQVVFGCWIDSLLFKPDDSALQCIEGGNLHVRHQTN